MARKLPRPIFVRGSMTRRDCWVVFRKEGDKEYELSFSTREKALEYIEGYNYGLQIQKQPPANFKGPWYIDPDGKYHHRTKSVTEKWDNFVSEPLEFKP